jgi:hypothetical protein
MPNSGTSTLLDGPRISRAPVRSFAPTVKAVAVPLLSSTSGFESNGVVHLLDGVFHTRSSVGRAGGPGLRDLPNQDGVLSVSRV